MWPFEPGFFDLRLFSRFIHFLACVNSSFFLGPDNLPLHDIPQFVYPFICRWIFGLFCVLGIVNHAAVNICVQLLLLFEHLFSIPRNRLAPSHANSVLNFLRSCENVFHSG